MKQLFDRAQGWKDKLKEKKILLFLAQAVSHSFSLLQVSVTQTALCLLASLCSLLLLLPLLPPSPRVFNEPASSHSPVCVYRIGNSFILSPLPASWKCNGLHISLFSSIFYSYMYWWGSCCFCLCLCCCLYLSFILSSLIGLIVLQIPYEYFVFSSYIIHTSESEAKWTEQKRKEPRTRRKRKLSLSLRILLLLIL